MFIPLSVLCLLLAVSFFPHPLVLAILGFMLRGTLVVPHCSCASSSYGRQKTLPWNESKQIQDTCCVSLPVPWECFLCLILFLSLFLPQPPRLLLPALPTSTI